MLQPDISMYVLNFFYSAIDFPQKLKFFILGKLGKFSVFSNSNRSDSESTEYSNYVLKVATGELPISHFRRDYRYRLILEHVTYKLGLAYLKSINPNKWEEYSQNSIIRKLSLIGSPRKFRYIGFGWVSPTILRYIFVNEEICKLFGRTNIKSVCEIGIGFGGQCAITVKSLNLENYALYDLPAVLEVSEKVLREAGVDMSSIARRNIENVTAEEFDLVISNYAFSELPSEVQEIYLEKVLSRAKRGYITMNSGRTNHTGRSTGKLSMDELLARIPEARVEDEFPLTGPDNYLIVWGDNKH